MMERQIERPIPSPSGLLVMKGSKMASSLSGGIPVPLSCTSTSTFDPSIEFVRTISCRAPLSPGFAHGAEGVEHQVQHDLLELNGVALDRGDAGRQVELDGRRCAAMASLWTMRSTLRMSWLRSSSVKPGVSRLSMSRMPTNDFAGALGDPVDVGERLANLLKVGLGCVEQLHSERRS